MKNAIFMTHENIDNTAVAKAMFYDIAVALKDNFKNIAFISASNNSCQDGIDENGVQNFFFQRKNQGKISIKDIYLLLRKLFFFAKISKSYDVLVFRSYPMLIMMYFFLKTVLRENRVVFDTRGLFFEELFDSGKLADSKIIRNLLAYIERKILTISNVVICVSEAQVEYYKKLTTSPEYQVIYNATLEPETKAKNISEPRFTIGYVGSLVSWHMPERVYSILKILERKQVDFTFHCITKDVVKANEIFGSLNRVKIYSHDYRRDPIKFDLGVCLIQGGISKEVCFPVKFAEYIAAETDVIFSDNMSVCNSISSRFDIGYSVSLESSDEIIAQRIAERLNNPVNVVKLPKDLDFNHSVAKYYQIIGLWE